MSEPDLTATIDSDNHAFPAIFDIGDRVHIDGEKDIVATVVGMLFRAHGVEVECSWLHNGSMQTAWVAAFRLKVAA